MEQPLPLEALGYLLWKDQKTHDWGSAEWGEVETEIRVKSFYSANIESARFLDRSQGLLFDFMAGVKEEVVSPSGKKSIALKVGSREQFVALMRDFMVAEGMASEDEFKDVNQKDVRDIRSRARLNLIFDNNVRQAYAYGQYKQGMTPTALHEFPAAKLVRDRGVKSPRDRHQAHLGDVMLKTDPRWAEYHNAADIGGFEVPWGPYGHNSGVGQEPQSRKVALKLGLIKPDEKIPSGEKAALTDKFAASVRKMDPETKRKLLAELRGGGDTGVKSTVIEEGEKIRVVPVELRQPTVSGPDGEPVEVAEDLAKRMVDAFTSAQNHNSGFVPLDIMTDQGREIVRSAEQEIRNKAREHVRVFSPDGLLLDSQAGEVNKVSVNTATLAGNILTHNHPEGTPPSFKDVLEMIRYDMGELRVVGEDYTFAARPNGVSAPSMYIEWEHLQRVAHALFEDQIKRGAEDGAASTTASITHAVLTELAARGIIKYDRRRND